MGDILREALAEAKLVKKVAIEAAREQLNEALTPKIESMLSKKIKEEMDDEDFDGEELDETEDPGKGEEGETKDNPDVTPDLKETEDPGSVTDKQEKDDQDVTSDLKEEEDIEIPEDEDDLEIEEMLKELEDDELPNDDEEELPVEEDEEVDIDIEPDDDEEIGEADLPGLEGVPDSEGSDDDEEINVEEILNSIDEEEYPGDDNDENKDYEEQNVVKTLESKNMKAIRSENSVNKKKLAQYGKVIKVLKNELSEVNLLNNKLFHTTKLLKKFNVSNKTKMGIIEQFDRARSVREVKLIFTTLYESLKSGSTVAKPKITSLKEVKQKTNSASKAIIRENYNPDPTILTEGDDLKKRFQKLANING